MVSLQTVTYADTSIFKVPVNEGRVVRVYDGDTFTIAAMLLGEWHRFSVRISGIDSPEMKGHTPEERAAAAVSCIALRDLIFHQVVTLHNIQHDKYGRILATVMFGDINISTWMLEHGHAVAYDGGKKKEFRV